MLISLCYRQDSNKIRVFIAGQYAGKDKNKIIEHKMMGYIKNPNHQVRVFCGAGGI